MLPTLLPTLVTGSLWLWWHPVRPVQQPQAYPVLSHLHEAPEVLLSQGKERTGNSAPMLLPGPWIIFKY